MAVLDKEAYMNTLRSRIGEDTSEEAIKFLEDMADTYADLEGRIGEDWKTKYEENDRQWRQKYRDRFFSGVPQESAEKDDALKEQSEDVKDDAKGDKTFEELFADPEGV